MYIRTTNGSNILQRRHEPCGNHKTARPIISLLGFQYKSNANSALSDSRVNRPAREAKVCAAIGSEVTDSSAAIDDSTKSTNGNGLEAAPPEPLQLFVQVVTGIEKVSAEEWDACASGNGVVNPFLLHAFLLALEITGCATREEGWLPQHVLVRDNATKQLLGAVPLYLKSHSYGEYVFDNAWASSYHRTGQSYYPKLQCCVPFTPATGVRLLLRASPSAPAVKRALAQTLRTITDELKVSSLHVTFTEEEEAQLLQQEGFLHRTGIQYHWHNRGYETFEDYLGVLKANKRKNVKQERKAVKAAGIELRRQDGHSLRPRDWDSFYSFYINTTDRKWGQAYLKRGFFHALGETMPDHVMMATAYQDGKMVAGALNLIGSDTIFGRNWGCAHGLDVKHLHFELCYYQAIEAAIERKLPRVEAGAQGEHKIQRGYLPSRTHSVHYIRDEGFREAVSTFLRRESGQIEYTLEALTAQASPYKQPQPLQST